MQIKYSGEQATAIRTRIQALIKQKGTTQEAVAASLGRHFTSVSRVLNTGIDLTSDWVSDFARALDEPTESLLPPIGNTRLVNVSGTVQAGHWAESWEWPEDDRYSVAVPVDRELGDGALHAAETRGPSMDLAYPEGTVIVFTDSVERGEGYRVGKRYVLERVKPDGMRETTVKTLWKDGDGKFWMLPESSDPRFKTPIPIEGEEGETVRLLGRVVYSVRRE